MSIYPHRHVTEYDGAYYCTDCRAMWGALPGKPVMPDECPFPGKALSWWAD